MTILTKPFDGAHGRPSYVIRDSFTIHWCTAEYLHFGIKKESPEITTLGSKYQVFVRIALFGIFDNFHARDVIELLDEIRRSESTRGLRSATQTAYHLRFQT